MHVVLNNQKKLNSTEDQTYNQVSRRKLMMMMMVVVVVVVMVVVVVVMMMMMMMMMMMTMTPMTINIKSNTSSLFLCMINTLSAHRSDCDS